MNYGVDEGPENSSKYFIFQNISFNWGYLYTVFLESYIELTIGI